MAHKAPYSRPMVGIYGGGGGIWDFGVAPPAAFPLLVLSLLRAYSSCWSGLPLGLCDSGTRRICSSGISPLWGFGDIAVWHSVHSGVQGIRHSRTLPLWRSSTLPLSTLLLCQCATLPLCHSSIMALWHAIVCNVGLLSFD